MSNYTQTTFFGPKDNLPLGNPAKYILGTDVDTELANIAAAISSKYDGSNIAGISIPFGNGSVGAPSISFQADSTTGFYRSAAETIGIAINGALLGSISATGLALASGSFSGSGANLTGIPNAALTNSAVTVTAGTGMSGGGAVSLGGSVTLSIGQAVGTGNSPTFAGLTANGTVNANLLVLPNNSAVQFKDSGGAPQSIVALSSTNNTQIIGHALGIVQLVGTTSAGGGGIGFYGGASSSQYGSMSYNGEWALGTPATGFVALTINGGSARPLQINGTGSASYIQIDRNSSAAGFVGSSDSVLSGGSASNFGVVAQGGLDLGTNGSTARLNISSAGAVTINAPSSGQALSVIGVAGSYACEIAGTASGGLFLSGGSSSTDAALTIYEHTQGTRLFAVFGDGGIVIGVPTGGNTGPGTLNAGNLFINGTAVGYLGTPLDSVAVNTTLALVHRGSAVYTGTAGLTITVPNAVFSAGDVVTIINASSGTMTIAQGASFTLLWANGTTTGTGNRTLTGYGVATVIFNASNEALITGSGLS